MALTDIVTSFGQSPVLDFDRGNIGVITEIVSRDNEFTTPVISAVCDYPVVDDVRLGVVYGSGTGTIELPAETDVLVGVQYGADGTEFTGEATGGGGGETSHVF